jgi:hypothetical protein
MPAEPRQIKDPDGHVAIKHDRTCERPYCMFCDGGLFACSVCGCLEGSTPDECPGVRMTEEQIDAVYGGRLNFRGGEWREECCQVMRPTHDLDAYMAEQGYIKIRDQWVQVVEQERTT